MTDKKEGLFFNDDKSKSFKMICQCGSENTEIEYEFNYYGGMTGYDASLYLRCRDCYKEEYFCIA